MKIKKYIIGFLVGAFGVLNVNAAKLEFDGDRSISYNGTGTVDIKLNSEGDEVKNIEFVLNYDTNFINISINKEQYNLVRKEDGKKVTITSTDPSVSIKDGVIATVTVKNVRPEQANTSLSIKEIKFDDKTGTDVTRDFVLKYTTTATTRAKNTSSKLSAITFKYGNIAEMTPTFKSNVFEYKIKNDNDKIRKLTFQRFACEEEGCKTEVSCTTNGCTVDGNSVYLVVGKNEVVVKNISEDEKNTTEYKFLVYRGPTTDGSPYLKSLAIEGFAINEKFDKNTLDYTATTDYEHETLNIIATPEDENAKVEIKGNENLKIGENVITITVTSSETKEIKIYNITVTRKDFEASSSTTTKAILAPDIKKKSNSNVLLIVIISVIGSAIIGASAYFIFRKPKDKNKNNKDNNGGTPELADDLPILKQDTDEKLDDTEINDNELEDELNIIENNEGVDDAPSIDDALRDLMVTKRLELTDDMKDE